MYKSGEKSSVESVIVKMKELVKGNDPDVVIADRSYGKGGVKILHVVKDGE